MKKKYILLALIALGMTACNTQPKETTNQSVVSENQNDKIEDKEETKETNENNDKNNNEEQSTAVKFSALGDENSQNETARILKSAGISDERVDEFISNVKKYNEYFGNKNGEFVDYVEPDYTQMIGNALADSTKAPNGIGNNCRITTFGLMRDFLTADAQVEDKTSVLDFDKASLKETNMFDESEMKKFETYYAPIMAADSSDVNEQIAAIKKSFVDRKIEFKNDKAKIVSVYLNSKDEIDGNILFVGHTGVMVEDVGKIYFVEKLSFQEPYQVLIFNNKKQLLDHLLKKYDLPLGEGTAKAVVFENGEVIEEFEK